MTWRCRLPVAGLLALVFVFSGALGSDDGGQGVASAQTFTFAKPSETVQDLLDEMDRNPKADTYYLLARSYYDHGKEGTALSVVERGLKLEPNNVKLLNFRASLWFKFGRLGDCIAEFKRVLKIDPKNTYARESLNALEPPTQTPVVSVFTPSTVSRKTAERPSEGVASGTDGKAAGASAKPARLLESAYFEEMANKQRCYFQLSALRRGQAAFELAKPENKGKFDLKALVSGKFLSAEPVCPDGGTFSFKGDTPSCSKHGDLASLEAEVHTVFNDFNDGLKAKFSRNYPDAKAAFKKVITLYPKWSEAYYQLGDTYFRLGEDKDAIEQIRKCLDIDRKNLDARLLLANLYYKTSHKDSAVKILQEILKTVPDSIHALSAKSILSSIQSGKNYYQVFPPE